MSAPTPARRAAYEVLRRVFEQGAYADRALRSAADRFSLEGRDRALAQRLAYGSVQRRGTCDHLIAELADRPASSIDPPLRAALRLGLFELLFDDGASAHAAVDQAVGLAKGGRDGERRHRGSGLVNAVLRRATREGAGLLDGLRHDSPAAAAIAFSVPTWIAELWWRERGEQRALSLLAAANEAPRRLYRPTGSVAGDDRLERLRALGVECELLAPELAAGCALLAVTGGEWTAVEAAVRAGELLPQSRGSALAAALLGVREGDRILDLCAAPGIKTTQLAAAAGSEGTVVAVERDAGRAREIGQLCERLGLDQVEVVCGDGTELDLGSGYDRVLVDAPCSGLGTLASRPDLRWRRSEADLAGLADLQSRLLAAGTGALRPGGRAIYAVCTISRAEGEGVVATALERDRQLRPLDLSSPFPSLADDRDPRSLQLLPDRDGSDGFFIAGVERVA